MIKVSIIIVTYNSEKHIEKCLRSIASHKTNCTYEVIVIDNQSNDGTSDIVSSFAHVKLSRNQHNLGFGSANNIGLHQAKGEYIFFINPDIMFTDYCMDKLLDTYLINNKRTDIGIVAPRLVYPNGQVQDSIRRLPNIFVQIFAKIPLLKGLFQSQTNYYLMKDWNKDNSRLIDWAIGAALLVPQKHLNELGGFDERFFLYCEDVDLCYRFREHGLATYYNADVSMIHDYQQDSSNKLSKFTWMHVRSMLKFYMKHPELTFRWLKK